MAEEINVPGAGPVKKQWVMVGGAVVIGIVGYAYFKRARSGGPATPVAVDPAAVDPAGGSTTPGISNGTATPPDPSNLPPADNATWTQRAIEYMQGIGYDPQLVAGVLGKYLAHVPLVPSEQDIVRTVEGVMSRPPVGTYAIVPVPNPPAGGGSTPPPSGNPPPAAGTASVQAGWHVDQWVNDMRAAGHTFSLDQFLTANPGKYTWANNNGYIDKLPPDKQASGGPAFRVFGANTTVTLPA